MNCYDEKDERNYFRNVISILKGRSAFSGTKANINSMKTAVFWF
jgi:hypothetical protein